MEILIKRSLEKKKKKKKLIFSQGSEEKSCINRTTKRWSGMVNSSTATKLKICLGKKHFHHPPRKASNKHHMNI